MSQQLYFDNALVKFFLGENKIQNMLSGREMNEQ